MKIKIVLLLTILLSACVSGPRPYDGVIGYKTEKLNTGLQISYVNEEKLSHEKAIRHLKKICAMKSAMAAEQLSIQIKSEESFLQAVNMSIPIPAGFQSDGTSVSNGASGKSFVAQNPTSQTETIVREMKLKRIVALCTAP